MSNRPKGRKRNIIDGNLKEIKKDEEKLDIDRVGDNTSLISRFLRRIRKAKVKNND